MRVVASMVFTASWGARVSHRRFLAGSGARVVNPHAGNPKSLCIARLKRASAAGNGAERPRDRRRAECADPDRWRRPAIPASAHGGAHAPHTVPNAKRFDGDISRHFALPVLLAVRNAPQRELEYDPLRRAQRDCGTSTTCPRPPGLQIGDCRGAMVIKQRA